MRTLSIILLCAAAASTLAARDLTARFQLTLDRVLTGNHPPYSAEFVLADAKPESGRRFTECSGDVSGRYVGALALASIESGRPFPSLDRMIPRLLELQKPDGHYGAAWGERITKSRLLGAVRRSYLDMRLVHFQRHAALGGTSNILRVRGALGNGQLTWRFGGG